MLVKKIKGLVAKDTPPRHYLIGLQNETEEHFMFGKPRTHLSDESLLAYLDGELGIISRHKARLHLQRCWRCRASLRELEELAEYAARIFARFEQEGKQRIQ
ncbi:MAG: hypothetical protein FWD64_05530 [Acidobacteriaceae bacterium]|nr:hypothetical protein [Acidobacteriaceae bacterium]